MFALRMCGVRTRGVEDDAWIFGLSTGTMEVLSAEMRKAEGRAGQRAGWNLELSLGHDFKMSVGHPSGTVKGAIR